MLIPSGLTQRQVFTTARRMGASTARRQATSRAAPERTPDGKGTRTRVSTPCNETNVYASIVVNFRSYNKGLISSSARLSTKRVVEAFSESFATPGTDA